MALSIKIDLNVHFATTNTLKKKKKKVYYYSFYIVYIPKCLYNDLYVDDIDVILFFFL